jgi:C-terminal peptidase prc
MAQGQLQTVVRHLRRLARAPEPELTDRQLLDRFTTAADESAFAILVERHGPLVWGVCRRLLARHHDAEDIFQATFLVLARKAPAVRWTDSVGGWLHEVAYRLSTEARFKSARRHFHEQKAGQEQATARESRSATQELCALVDEQLHRLPEKLRVPVLLCYLEGLTRDQAARQLGWSLRTLDRRLAQGRELLRRRLIQQGVTLSAGLLVPVLTASSASAALPTALKSATVQAAGAFTAGDSATIAGGALAKAYLKGMTMLRWKWAAVVCLSLGLTAGGGLLAQRAVSSAAGSQQAPETAKSRDPAKADKPDQPAADDFAGQVWDIMEIVSKQHLEPCPRVEMIAAGVRGLLEAAEVKPPADLPRRAEAIQTREQYAAFLREIWPQGEKAPPRAKLEEALVQGLSKRIPGEVKLLPPMNLKIEEQISGNRYVGIGIQVRIDPKEEVPQIVVAMRRGTARAAGIRANDLMIKVEDKGTRGVALPKIIDWLRGDVGTKVTVVMKRPGTGETRTYQLTRAVVPFDSLAGYRRLAEDGWDYHVDPATPIAYVRVDSLRISTLQELRQLEPKLQAGGYKALILDLRFAQGDGHLRNAAMLANGLLDSGLLWTVRGADPKSRTEMRADRECLFRHWPVALLINDSLDRQHAIVAAALQDNHRAILVGEPTKTDGYVNALVKLPDGKRAIIFRTGMIERPDRDRGWPVKPDAQVALSGKQKEAIAEWQRKQEIAEEPTNDKAPEDPQLARAVQVLRDALSKPATPDKSGGAGK